MDMPKALMKTIFKIKTFEVKLWMLLVVGAVVLILMAATGVGPISGDWINDPTVSS